MEAIIILAAWTLLGFITAHFAKQRGRDQTWWFFVGLFMGVLGPLILFIMPDLSKQSNLEVVKADPPPPNPFEGTEWFFLDSDTKQHGPISYTDLKKLWEEGVLGTRTYVWSESMTDWKRIGDLEDLLQEREGTKRTKMT